MECSLLLMFLRKLVNDHSGCQQNSVGTCTDPLYTSGFLSPLADSSAYHGRCSSWIASVPTGAASTSLLGPPPGLLTPPVATDLSQNARHLQVSWAFCLVSFSTREDLSMHGCPMLSFLHDVVHPS